MPSPAVEASTLASSREPPWRPSAPICMGYAAFDLIGARHRYGPGQIRDRERPRIQFAAALPATMGQSSMSGCGGTAGRRRWRCLSAIANPAPLIWSGGRRRELVDNRYRVAERTLPALAGTGVTAGAVATGSSRAGGAARRLQRGPWRFRRSACPSVDRQALKEDGAPAGI